MLGVPPLPDAAGPAPGSYIVRAGDTLSGIARDRCGSAAAYPALARASGIADANLIYPGQRVVLSCHGSPAVALALAAPDPPGHHDRFDGHHGACGDGDHDGYDASCSVIFPGSRPAADPAAPRAGSGVRVLPGPPAAASSYGFGGLERLWMAAGGPGWAAFSAATIAMCESGGNPRAYNPSGASGLWQILGIPFAGDPFDPWTNARMAVWKFRDAGDSFAPWVCRP